MIYEFQVLYVRQGSNEVKSIEVQAPTSESAKARVENHLMTVVSVGPGIPVFNWDQKIFNREEAAFYLRISAGELSNRVAEGKIAMCKDGKPLFRRQDLDRYLETIHQGVAA